MGADGQAVRRVGRARDRGAGGHFRIAGRHGAARRRLRTLTGVPDPGERVRLEVSALDRALGTGGHAMVCARFDVLPADTSHEGISSRPATCPTRSWSPEWMSRGTIHHGLLSSPVGELMLEGPR